MLDQAGQKTKDQWLYARSEDYQVDAIARVRILETSGSMPGQNTLDQWMYARSGNFQEVFSGCMPILINKITGF